MAVHSFEEIIRSLSKDEIYILYYRCKGFKVKKVAEDLGYERKGGYYSVDSVQYHMSSIYRKFGIEKDMHWQKRKEFLRNTIKPIVFSIVKSEKDLAEWEPIPLENETEIIPSPEALEVFRAMVIYDEAAEDAEEELEKEYKDKIELIIEPIKQIIIKEEKKKKRNPLLFWLYTALVIASLGAVAYFAYDYGKRVGGEIVVRITAIVTANPPTVNVTANPPTVVVTLVSAVNPALATEVPTIPTLIPTTQPTQVQTLGLYSELKDDRVGLALKDVSFDHKMYWALRTVAFRYIFDNHSGGDVFLQFDGDNFKMVDNLGMEHLCDFLVPPFIGSSQTGEKSVTVENGKTFEFWVRCGELEVSKDQDQFTLLMNSFSSLPDESWFVEVPR